MKTANELKRRARIVALSSFVAFSSITAFAETATIETPAPAAIVCAQCGLIENIREVRQEGESTGLGTVAGGLLGGLLGRQLGEDGSTLGMLLGMAGGAYAGNKFEQHRNKSVQYEVTVRMDDGSQRVLTYDSRPVWQVGERVNFGRSGMVRSGQDRPPLADRGGVSI